MPTPPRRVFAGPVTPRRRPIEHTFDPAANPRGGLGLFGPDRLDRLHHQADIDSLHRQAAEHWVDVSTECYRPLRSVLRVAPACLVSLDVPLGTILECQRFCA